MPKYIKKLLMQSFKGQRSSIYPEFFIVENLKLENYLVKKIGIYSDSPIIELDCFKVKFNWYIQKFMISA